MKSLLRVVACLFLCVSLNSFGATFYYKGSDNWPYGVNNLYSINTETNENSLVKANISWTPRTTNDGLIWGTEGTSIYAFNPNTSLYEEHDYNYYGGNINSMAFRNDGLLALGTSSQGNYYSPINTLTPNGQTSHLTYGKDGTTMIFDSEGAFYWIYEAGSGMSLKKRDANLSPSSEVGLAHFNTCCGIYSMAFDNNNRLLYNFSQNIMAEPANNIFQYNSESIKILSDYERNIYFFTLNSNKIYSFDGTGVAQELLQLPNDIKVLSNLVSPSPVPLPAGIYLFLSGLVGLVGAKLRGRNG